VKLVLKSDIALANRIVPMSFACKAIGMEDIDYASSGAKVECPFESVFHPGGGKSFRIYDDATAYCYACAERYLPVSVYSIAKDVSLDDAAEQLLEAFGYKPPTAEVRFEEAVKSKSIIDQTSLEEALKTFCARNFPQWEIAQFEDEVAAKFRQCVGLLPTVHSPEEIKTWLEATKKAMTKVLGDVND
jgi:hypothetical protein